MLLGPSMYLQYERTCNKCSRKQKHLSDFSKMELFRRCSQKRNFAKNEDGILFSSLPLPIPTAMNSGWKRDKFSSFPFSVLFLASSLLPANRADNSTFPLPVSLSSLCSQWPYLSTVREPRLFCPKKKVMSPELIPWKIILAVTAEAQELDPVLGRLKCLSTPPLPPNKREDEISFLKSWMLLLEDWRLLLSLEVLLMDIYEDGQKCRHF